MSRKGVAIVIGRAAVDDCYRNYLKEHPNDELDGYELSRERGRRSPVSITSRSTGSRKT